MAAAGDPEGGVRVLSTQGWCWDLRPVGQVKGLGCTLHWEGGGEGGKRGREERKVSSRMKGMQKGVEGEMEEGDRSE